MIDNCINLRPTVTIHAFKRHCIRLARDTFTQSSHEWRIQCSVKTGFHPNAIACVGKQPIMVATASTEHPIGYPMQAHAFSPVSIQTQHTQRTQRKRLRLDGNRASVFVFYVLRKSRYVVFRSQTVKLPFSVTLMALRRFTQCWTAAMELATDPHVPGRAFSCLRKIER